MSKHEAMVEYLKQYPGLRSFLYFNTITDKSGKSPPARGAWIEI